MKLAALFKQKPPFADICQKLREAVQTKKIKATDPAGEAIARVFDSLDLTEFVMLLEEFGADPNLDTRDAQTLLAYLGQLDLKYQMAHRITLEKPIEHPSTKH